jgi:glycolate oxidase FAD binding subunit
VSTAGTVNALARDLRAICGAEFVREEAAKDHAFWAPPAVAVLPGSVEEVAALLQIANKNATPVIPAGGFTQQPPRTSSVPEIVLYTSRLTAIEHYDPGDLTIGIGAGCTVAQLTNRVAQDGLLFAGDTARPEHATVGGLLAAGFAGPLRHGYGGLRDYCIGVRFVTGDGRTGKGGGRVVKNVAGFDLMKLLIGSWGTLAVITGASFKLFPAPRQTATFVGEFAGAADALKFRDAILHSPLSPMCLELVSPSALESARAQLKLGKSWLICLRASGSDAVLGRYRAELGQAVSRELHSHSDQEQGLWRALADFPHGDSGAAEAIADTLDIFAPVQEMGTVIDQLAATGMGVSMIGRVGIGHLRAALRAETASALERALEELCRSLPAHSSLITRNGSRLRTPTNLKSMRAVKNALDPNGILNPGRFAF